MIKNKTKKCYDCGKDKPYKDFHHFGGSRNNISKYCLTCHDDRLKIEQTKLDLFNKGLKTCVRCKETKQLFMFNNNRASNDRKNCYCKPCAKIVNKQYPVNKELKLANKQRYRMKNRIIINQKQNKKRNCRRFRSMLHKANSTSKKLGGKSLTLFQLWKLAKKQKLLCAISGKKLNNNNISLDHIIPFCHGGENVIENIQFIDYDINIMKNSHGQQEFLNLIKEIYEFNFNSPNKVSS